MTEQLIIVDRIEKDMAVCEKDGVFIDIPISQIKGNVNEGDKLYFDEGSAEYIIDAKGTEERRNQISAHFERIKNRRK